MQKKKQKEWFSKRLVCGRKLCNEGGATRVRQFKMDIWSLSESCLQIIILLGFSALDKPFRIWRIYSMAIVVKIVQLSQFQLC